MQYVYFPKNREQDFPGLGGLNRRELVHVAPDKAGGPEKQERRDHAGT